MTKWILIFYMYGASSGGPGVAYFPSRDACNQAAQTIKESGLKMRMEGWVCIRESNGKAGE